MENASAVFLAKSPHSEIIKVMNTKITKLFDEYHDYHKHPVNQALHYIGVYTIMISILGLLSQITFGGTVFINQLFRPDGASAILLLSLFFYFYMDWKLSLPFTLVLGGCYFIGRSLSLPVLILFQGGGWIVQLIGHYKFEKRSPALVDNLVHMLIGPFWLFAKAIGYIEDKS